MSPAACSREAGEERFMVAARRRAGRRPGVSARRRVARRARALEALEPRTLLAVLPPPAVATVVQTDPATGQTRLVPVRQNVSNPTNTVASLRTNESSPSIAVSPNDPRKLVAVWTEGAQVPTNATPVASRAAYSLDGGQSWTPLALPQPVFDPSLPPTSTQRLTRVTDASVAFDRGDAVYILASQQFTSNTRGALVLQKFDFRGAAPAQVLRDKIVYAWSGDAALQPVLAVDATLPSYIDPNTGQSLANPYAGNVYIAWATDDLVGGTPNTIKMVASSDGGNTFTARRTINDEQRGDGTFFQPTAPGVFPANRSGNTGVQRNVLPRLAVSQGTVGGSVAPGQVTILWDDFTSGPIVVNQNVDLIRSDRIVGAVGQTFSTAGVIRSIDARQPNPPSEVVSSFPITVNITDPRFTTVSDLDFRIAISNPGFANLAVELVAPDGRVLPLVPLGGVGAGLGVGAGDQVFGTVFDEEAITPFGALPAPSVGNFLPVWQFPPQAPALPSTFNLSDFYGKGPGGVAGTWVVRVRNTSPLFDPDRVPVLRDASLIFTSGLRPGADTIVANTLIRGRVSVDAPRSGDKVPYPLITAAQFDRGVGPAPALAADNTPGALLDHAGRIYVAYTDYARNAAGARITPQLDNTDIFLKLSDDGGRTWSAPRMVNDDTDANRDGFSESFVTPGLTRGRPQFQPSLAVDQATGTLAVSFFDARHDAARARVATTVTVSLDGGLSFSPQAFSFANAPNAPFDVIERNPAGTVLGPIPDNLSEGNPTALTFTREGAPGWGFGDRQGLAFASGQLYAAWSGNENGGNQGLNLLDIRVARLATAAGPRVVASTMGPVQATTVDGVTFNAQFGGDGAPRVEGFMVQFDRPIDARSFGTDDVTVYFRRPTDPAGALGELMAVQSVTPLDPSGPNVGGRQIKATRFLVRLDDTNPARLSRVGTYSYAVGPDIVDFAGASLTALVPTAAVSQATAAVPPFVAVQGLPLTIPANGQVEAPLDVAGFRPDDALASIEATLSILHPQVGDLRLFLVGPGGTTVALARNRGGAGDNFENTTFSDAAAVPIAAGVAPFDGAFRPEDALAALAGRAVNGTYRLRIVNTGSQPGTLTAFQVKARTGLDVGSAPLGLPDTGRAAATLDVAGFQAAETIAGLRVLTTINHPRPADLQLVLVAPDGTRVPLSSLSVNTVTALNGKPVNGTYRLEVTDTQAGSVGTVSDFALEITAATRVNLSVGAIPDLNVLNARATLTGFSPGQRVARVTANVTVTHPRSRDLRLSLIGSDGTTVPLATNLGGSAANAYTDTTFDDAAATAITAASPPFTGSFRPESALAGLVGKPVNGDWTLRFSDTVAGGGGTVTAAALTIETRTLVAGAGARLAVPDGADRAVTTLAVAPAGTVAGVEATVSIDHARVQELSAYLVAPDGRRVLLIDPSFTAPNPGAVTGVNLRNTVFSDTGADLATGAAPYTGRFKPADPSGMAQLVGAPANGVWQLEVVDRAGNSVAGAIRSWSLDVRTASPFASPDVPRAIPDNNAGGVASSLGVFGTPPGARIANVAGALEVTLNVTHPAVQELSVTLVAPDGVTQIPLVVAGGTGATGANFTNTIFSNAPGAIALSAGTAPYNSSVNPFPRFLPEGGVSLDTLAGIDPSGIWTLRVSDTVGGTNPNVGTLTGWSLRIQTTSSYGEAPSAPVPASGVGIATFTVADFPAGVTLDQVEATVSVRHTNSGSLSLYLVGPDGTRVALATNRGGSADDAYTNTTFTDDPNATPIGTATAPFTGRFRPEGLAGETPLASAFGGKSGAAVNGTWRLEVVNGSGTPGTITGFQLALRAGAVLGLLPGPIPDGAQATATIDVSGLPAGEVIAGVEVGTSIQHPRLADLLLTLVAPDGTRVVLFDGKDVNNANIDGADLQGTVFADDATRGVIDLPPAGLATFAPFAGRFRPRQALAALIGRQPNGVWRLEVQDRAIGEVGSLQDFRLRIRTAPRFAANDLPKPIPNAADASTPGVVTSTVAVSGINDTLDRLADLNVNVTLTHPEVNNLRLFLVGPDGTRVPLVTNATYVPAIPGPITGRDLDTAFDDDAATPITAGAPAAAAPFRGRFRPQFPLAAFEGRPVNGTWTLEVQDTVPGTQDAAALLAWSLELQMATRGGRTPLPVNDLSQVSSALLVSNAPANSIVDGVTVTVALNHPRASDLELWLIAPDGTTRVPLSLRNGGDAADAYANTTFDDAAAQGLTTDTATFNGTFRPQAPLAALRGLAPNGLWRLLVLDVSSATPVIDEGILNSWSITLRTARRVHTPPAGNVMDQDTDGTPGEETDAYAAPRSFAGFPFATPLDRGVNGTPFQFPFDPTALPLIVPGPHLVDVRVPDPANPNVYLPKTPDNLVTDRGVSAIDVTFDRDMDAATFTGADVLRIDGPTGVIGPDAGAAVPATFSVAPATPGNRRTFRISVRTPAGAPLALSTSGTYSVVLGPEIESLTRNPAEPGHGYRIDANLNAGLDALRGLDILRPDANLVSLTVNAPPNQVGVAIPAATQAGPGVVSSLITVADDFLIRDLNVQLDIAHTNVPDLEARLVGLDPGGDPSKDIIVLLFSGVGRTGSRTDFRGTIFDDEAGTPVQNAEAPFPFSYSPQTGLGRPLSAFDNQSAARTYRLEIINRGTVVGRLNSWSLQLLKPVPGTGLGELVADRSTASVRVFTFDPTNPLAANTWTAVGPNGIGARGPGLNAEVAGRVNAVAVDPSDPSGNTVYAGAASGGLWKTTNFLTTSPAGPTWVPLTDDGPAAGLRIGAIAIVARNSDPNQSIILVGTGDGQALGDPLRTDTGVSRQPSEPTTRGVGFLRSTDGGKTWALLDSRNNNLPFAGRDHFFSAGNGTAAYKVAADPRLTPDGEAIFYAALADVGPNGGDDYNQNITARGGVIRGGLWRSVDSGRTWTQMRAGQATDVVLDLNSATGAPGGNVQRLYAAFRNDGIYESPNRGQLWNPMPGITGVPLIQNADVLGPGGQPQPVASVGPPQRQGFQTGDQAFFTPGGSNRTTPNSYTTNTGGIATPATAGEPRLGRIILAKPEPIGDTLKDALYQGWLYAAVMIHNQDTPDGDLVQFPNRPQDPPSALWGLFLTKDYGATWTRIMIPTLFGVPTNWFNPANPIGLTPQVDPTGVGTPTGNYYFKANFASSLAVDPNNPNIIYFGSTDTYGAADLLRIDVTPLADAHAFYLSNDDSDQQATQGQFRTYAGFAGPSNSNAGPLNPLNAVGSPLTLFYVPPYPYYGPDRDPALTPAGAYNPKTQPFLNLLRDPARPFDVNATIPVSGVAHFNNTGTKSRWTPFLRATQPDPFLDPSTDTWSRPTRNFHQILTLRDPLTGRARLIFANDEGVFTAVDEGDGTLAGSLGSVADLTTTAGDVPIVNGSRNGNLAIAQFRAGASQPSTLSAELATIKGMFYGTGEDTGQPASDPGIINVGAPGYGNLSWRGTRLLEPNPVRGGEADLTREHGYGVGVGQNIDPVTGRIVDYVYYFANPEGLVERDYPGDRFHPSTDFFQANGISVTNGLVQLPGGGDVPDPQWPFRRGFPFAVNPRDGGQVVISSAAGRLFGRDVSAFGDQWVEIGNPSVLDGSVAQALAFGAPKPQQPGDPPPVFNDLIYAGTAAGRVFVTFTGGGTPGVGNQWTNLSAGLDGSPVWAIATNPDPGSHEAYAVTARGVYHMIDSSVAGATWVNITGNLFSVSSNPLDDPLVGPQPRLGDLRAIQVDWRYVIPDSFANPSGPTHPLLYVAGEGGVFRSLDRGATWRLFPDTTFNGAPLGDGGGLPNARVTDLDLALGPIDQATGRPDTSRGPNILLASTYGRGQYAIRLAPLVFPNQAGQPRLLGIAPESDSGLFNDDQVTNVRDPFVVGLSEQTAFGNIVYVTLYDLTDPAHPRFIGGFDPASNPGSAANRANLAIQTDERGRFKVRVNPNALTSDGVKTIGVQATSLSGTRGNMATFTFELDTTRPNAPQRPELLLESDTGLNNDGQALDQITRLNAGLQFRIGFDAVDAGAQVTLFRNNAQVGIPTQGSGSVVIVDQGPVADGTFPYKARIVDLAGNVSEFGGVLNVRVDTRKPAPPSTPDLDPASDTGPSNTDNITSDQQPLFTGTAEANTLANPNDASITQANVVELVDQNNNVVGTAKVSRDGKYAVRPSADLANGNYTFRVQVIDVAGNVSDRSGSIDVTILHVAIAKPTLRLDRGSDSGAADNITNVTRPLLVGTGVAGLTVTLINPANGAVLAPRPGEDPIKVRDDRTFSYQFLNPPLADGVYRIIARTSDVAGNFADSDELVLTILTQGPTQSVTLILPPSQDTGIKGPQGGVYVTSLRPLDLQAGFPVPLPASVTAVQLVRADGAVLDTRSVVGNTTGVATLRLPQDLVNGTIVLRARLLDGADNPGPASAALTLRIATTDGDLNADGRGDLAVYRPTTGAYLSQPAAAAPAGGQFTDVPLMGDLDGDGRVDLGTFRPSTATFTFQLSRSNSTFVRTFGALAARPVPVVADFDGDGRDDLAVFDRASGFWRIAIGTGVLERPLGAADDLPFAVDIDGDGKADTGVFRPSTGRWIVQRSGGGPNLDLVFGAPGDSPVPADYAGTGRAQLAVFRPGTGELIVGLGTGPVTTRFNPGDVPVPLDYGNDGKVDPAVFRPAAGQWIIAQSEQGGALRTVNLGTLGDLPLPAPVEYRLAARPVLRLAADSDTGVVGDGITSNRRPRLEGRGAPGQPARLIDLDGRITGTAGAVLLGPVTTAADGSFSFQMPGDLANGTYRFVARVGDGTSAVDSAPLVLQIVPSNSGGGTLPAPTLSLLPDDDTGRKGDNQTSVHRPRLLASSTASGPVTVQLVTVNNQVLDSRTLSGPGTVTLQPPTALLNGVHRFWARLVDASGNAGPLSSPWLDLRLVTVAGDLDGDGRADVFTYDRSSGGFRVQTTTGANVDAPTGGTRRDVPIHGDFDGDGRADLGYFRPDTATWVIQRSSLGRLERQFGPGGGHVPVVADFDGDGRDDIGVFVRSSATWFLLESSAGVVKTQYGPGGADVIPVAADFDGDRRADIGVFNPANAVWYLSRTAAGNLKTQYGDGRRDVPAVADYDGDGKADLALFRAVEGRYLVRFSGGGSLSMDLTSSTTAQPAPLDHDGDGKADPTIFKPSTGGWTIARSGSNYSRRETRLAGDVAVAAPYQPWRVPPAGVTVAADGVPGTGLAAAFKKRKGR
jgi:subtilisin-like proprotein convertase family protein